MFITMDIRRVVGLNLKRLRDVLDISQEAMADKAGIHRTYISGVERGVRNPTVLVLAKIAEAAGADPDELLRPIEPKQKPKGRKA